MRLKLKSQSVINKISPFEALPLMLQCVDAVPLNLIKANRDFHNTKKVAEYDDELRNCIVALVTARRLLKNVMKL